MSMSSRGLFCLTYCETNRSLEDFALKQETMAEAASNSGFICCCQPCERLQMFSLQASQNDVVYCSMRCLTEVEVCPGRTDPSACAPLPAL